jgi:hypothetical protein
MPWQAKYQKPPRSAVELMVQIRGRQRACVLRLPRDPGFLNYLRVQELIHQLPMVKEFLDMLSSHMVEKSAIKRANGTSFEEIAAPQICAHIIHELQAQAGAQGKSPPSYCTYLNVKWQGKGIGGEIDAIIVANGRVVARVELKARSLELAAAFSQHERSTDPEVYTHVDGDRVTFAYEDWSKVPIYVGTIIAKHPYRNQVPPSIISLVGDLFKPGSKISKRLDIRTLDPRIQRIQELLDPEFLHSIQQIIDLIRSVHAEAGRPLTMSNIQTLRTRASHIYVFENQ